MQANLDNKMALRGYDASLRDGPGGRELAVTLYWKALAPMDRDYTVFVPVVGPDGERLAQHDAQPRWGVSLPTSTWQPGEDVLDQHVLGLPPGLAPGAYRLQVGVYYWQTLERLPVMEDNVAVNNYVELGSVALE